MKKAGAVAGILATALILTGCSLPTLEGSRKIQPDSFQNVYDLTDDLVYVWKDKGYGSLEKDLSKTRTGREAFFTAPKGTISFTRHETDDLGQEPRNIWFEDAADKSIPTVTRKDALLYVSKTDIPKEIIFERFYDNGYSIGIAGMQEDKGGHFYIPYAEDREDDYQYYIDPESGASVLAGFDGIERLYLDRAGDEPVSSENVSAGGCVTGLIKDKTYDCQFYTGTFYQDFTLTANVRTFTSLERFESYEYSFLHANCISLKLPEYLKSGYYMVLGKGLIRYVAPEDEEKYSGQEYDTVIDWNDPIKQYDEYGLCIYDPSTGTGMEEGSEDASGDGSDAGLLEQEMMEENDTDGEKPERK
ncbi:MAG: hypothetical protein K6E75_03195 [Lachnospiraceae bacterium]|nr:hypothetical protein [Lachnospiraceae bacterium]